MRAADRLLTVKVGDGARDLLNARHRAHGEVVFLARPLDHRLAFAIQAADLCDLPGRERRVAAHAAAGVARALPFPCRLNARTDGAGRLLRRAGRDLAYRQRGHLQLQVDAVEQRPGDAGAIARDLLRAAAAGLPAAIAAAGLCCAY